jgi:predicted TIM-barrel fold metal-dependent hydrolase
VALPFVDAHVHFWDRDLLRYPWLENPAMAAIGSTYSPAHYRAEAAAWNLVAAVHVEAGAQQEDSEAESVWLDECAETSGLPTAFVAREALDDPDLDRKLARLAEHGRVKGVRHLVNWHPLDAARRAYPSNLTVSEVWRKGYARLGAYGFSFDFHGFPPQLPGLVELARRHPEVPVILNHLALPILSDGLEAWRTGLDAFAALPHAVIKLSGAGYIHSPFDPAIFRDLVLEVIERFGTSRVMVASNFPVDRLFASLDETLGAYEAILSRFSEEERRDLWGRNANRVYRLGLTL